MSTDAVSITAHRGGAGYAPENTMAGFARTTALGLAEWVDFDVQRTRDGVLVAVHDVTLVRTTDVAEVFPDRAGDSVGDFTLAELRSLDAGSWFRPGEYRGEQIPTFSEAIEFLTGRAGITFELKHPIHHPGIEGQVADALRRHGLLGSADVRVGSFDHDSLRRLRAAAPAIAVTPAFRAAHELRDAAAIVLAASVAVSPQHTPEHLDLARRHGWEVEVTANSPVRMVQALDDGIRHVASDYPDVLARVVQGTTPFDEQPALTIDDVLVDRQTEQRIAVLRNVGTEPVLVIGWYLWDGVATRVDRGLPTVNPGESRRIPLDPPRARNVSSVQTLALHDDRNRLRDLHEFWAVEKPARV